MQIMSDITKHALESALKELLREKPLDKITINDLTTACGISRTAFYYHFQDIYALVEWACMQDFSKALGGRKTHDTWETGFRQIFDEIYRDKDFIYNVYRYTDHGAIVRYLNQRTFDLLYGVVDELSAEMDVTEGQKRFIADFYKYAFVGLVLNWVDGGMKEDSDELVRRLGVMLGGSFEHALEAFRLDNRADLSKN